MSETILACRVAFLLFAFLLEFRSSCHNTPFYHRAYRSQKLMLPCPIYTKVYLVL